MKEAISQIFHGIHAVKDTVHAIAPGLRNVAPDVNAEVSRLGTQGATELAGALFAGQAFTPDGPGEYPPDRDTVSVVSPQLESPEQPQQQAEQTRGIER